MQGLWSAHRKAKLNLNAAVPQTTTSTTGLTVSSPSLKSPQLDELLEVVQPTSENHPEAPIAADVRPPSSKRKLSRTVMDNEGTKRPRAATAASGSGGSTSKPYAPPHTRLSDLGGVEVCIETMLELVAMPLCHPEIYLHTGVQPPRGVLLHGPPGCDKTLLANAIAGVILSVSLSWMY